MTTSAPTPPTVSATPTPVRISVLHIIHHDDHDGIVGAAVAMTTNVSGYKQIELHPTQYGKPLPISIEELQPDDAVYIIDFSYSREILESIYARTKNFIVLDHHVGMKDQIADLPYVMFDETRSGAKLAWDHFTEGYYGDNCVINIVDAYDLWNKDYQDNTVSLLTEDGTTKNTLGWRDAVAYHLGTLSTQKNVAFWVEQIQSFKIDIGILNTGLEMYGQILTVAEEIDSPLDLFAPNGVATWTGETSGIIFAGNRKSVSLVSDALLYVIDEKGNSTKIPKRDISFCYFEAKDEPGQMSVSVRSSIGSVKITALEVAKAFGGGGHTNAAGFKIAYSGAKVWFSEFLMGKLSELKWM